MREKSFVCSLFVRCSLVLVSRICTGHSSSWVVGVTARSISLTVAVVLLFYDWEMVGMRIAWKYGTLSPVELRPLFWRIDSVSLSFPIPLGFKIFHIFAGLSVSLSFPIPQPATKIRPSLESFRPFSRAVWFKIFHIFAGLRFGRFVWWQTLVTLPIVQTRIIFEIQFQKALCLPLFRVRVPLAFMPAPSVRIWHIRLAQLKCTTLFCPSVRIFFAID